MHLGGFDLNLLIALDALLREKNVTRAAERMFVSQPAMSVALAKLRHHFDDPLLVRVGQDFELSARGLPLVEPVREMLLRAQRVLGTQPVFDASSVHRTFSIMIPDFVIPLLLPRILHRLGEWVDLLVTLDSSNVIGLEHSPHSLCRTTLRVQRWVCAVSSDHPLVQAPLTRDGSAPRVIANPGRSTTDR